MTNATFHGPIRTEQFADRGSGARTDIAAARGLPGRCSTGGIAAGRIGSGPRIVTLSHQRQVKQDGCRDDGHPSKAGLKPQALFLEPLHGT